MVKFLEKGLPGIQTEWSKWRLFFCDERIVPTDSEDSTFGAYKNALVGKTPITEDQFIIVDPDMSGKY
jgi:6-phosphogluconolactonase